MTTCIGIASNWVECRISPENTEPKALQTLYWSSLSSVLLNCVLRGARYGKVLFGRS